MFPISVREFLVSFEKFLYLRRHLFPLRTRQAFVAHRRKKSLLTVKDSLADSGRSSKTSGSSGRRVKDREDREDREVQQQLVAASPSDLLQDTAVSLSQQEALSHHQYGSFYLRLGTVSKFTSSPLLS